MLVVIVRRTRHGPETVEDQVSTDIRDEVQTSKSNLMARGVASNLLQMAERIGLQYEAANENLSGKKGFSLDSVTIDDRRGHRSFRRRHSGTLNESTNVGVKIGRSRVGGPELCV